MKQILVSKAENNQGIRHGDDDHAIKKSSLPCIERSQLRSSPLGGMESPTRNPPTPETPKHNKKRHSFRCVLNV